MSSSDLRVLLTGAAGVIGRDLRDGLAGRYARLRLTDVRDLGAARPGEELVRADLTSLDEALAVTRDVDVVLHFAGVPREGAWEQILPNNIVAAYNVFEAAWRNGVLRVVYASSNHVVGFYRTERELDVDEVPRPDSRYGVSKVFGEALGRLYADKHGMSAVALRIGSYRRQPENRRQLATWCSPGDLLRLVTRCIEVPDLHYAVFYGVSANRRARWHDDSRAKLGYQAVDNAEDYAAQLPPEPEGEVTPAVAFHGGHLAAAEFDGDISGVD